MSLALIGAFGRWLLIAVSDGTDTTAETVSVTAPFPVAGGLVGAGTVAMFGARVAALAGVLDAIAAVNGQRWP